MIGVMEADTGEVGRSFYKSIICSSVLVLDYLVVLLFTSADVKIIILY